MNSRTLIRQRPWGVMAGVILGCMMAMQFAAAAGAEEPVRESAACMDCHEDQDLSLALTAHALDLEAAISAARVACTDCHGGNSLHWEDDPETNPMINPAKLLSSEEAALCGSCHLNSHQQNMAEKNVHARSAVNCSGCHSVHSSHENTTLLKAQESTLCYSCHSGVEGQFARSSRHPVNDDIVRCSDCHMTLDQTRGELSWNGTNVCTSCHGEFAGPFVFEHPATLDFSTEEGGCLACHAAHGSNNPRMLEQPYEPPHFQLCTQCHTIPPTHNSNAQHGTQWMGLACNNCHSDIHGSYTNQFFLSESLAADGCLNAGCHGR